MERTLAPLSELADLKGACRRRTVAARCGSLVFLNGPQDNQCCSGGKGACGCMHAEARLIVHMLRKRLTHPHLEVTLSPCVHCAHLIVDSGLFGRVTYLHDYRDYAGMRVLRNAGVEVTKWRP
jgi:deoxycytidylate deaminase